jgi:hypothetical protein
MIFVSPTGSDAAAGTSLTPLATLQAALLKNDPHIVVEPGEYTAQTAQRRPATMTTIEAWGATFLGGLPMKGSKNLTLRGGRIEGTTNLESSSGSTSPPEDIVLFGVEIKGTVKILNLAKRIVLAKLHIHDSGAGVTFPGRESIAQSPTTSTLVSDGVSILDCLIERMTADGIQATDVNNLLVKGNTIRNIHDPAGIQHNDCVQLGGGNVHVQIIDNDLDDSGAQLLFLQDAIRPISDVLVKGNTILRCAAVACQAQGIADLRFVDNFLDGGDEGSLWLRSGFRGDLPADTIVMNNFFRSTDKPSYRKWDGYTPLVEQGNVSL